MLSGDRRGHTAGDQRDDDEGGESCRPMPPRAQNPHEVISIVLGSPGPLQGGSSVSVSGSVVAITWVPSTTNAIDTGWIGGGFQ